MQIYFFEVFKTCLILDELKGNKSSLNIKFKEKSYQSVHDILCSYFYVEHLYTFINFLKKGK